MVGQDCRTPFPLLEPRFREGVLLVDENTVHSGLTATVGCHILSTVWDSVLTYTDSDPVPLLSYVRHRCPTAQMGNYFCVVERVLQSSLLHFYRKKIQHNAILSWGVIVVITQFTKVNCIHHFSRRTDNSLKMGAPVGAPLTPTSLMLCTISRSLGNRCATHILNDGI